MNIYLKKLELLGFKSFPERITLELHKGITAVIGPNGCGKSNLVDAVLWVLGEQRIKNLRGENNEDLIFSGSSSKKPLGMTEVDAYFSRNGDEVSICRRYFRSGDNKYVINNRHCRHKDIQDLLFELGIGERNYFIFEQGSIEKIVGLKPTERRVLIEEAAGISQYLERKKEIANKLIIAQQNLENLGTIMSDKAIRLKELKNQVQFAQRYRKSKNQKNDLHKSVLKKKFDTLQAELHVQGHAIEELLNQEAVLVRDITAGEKTIVDLEQQRWNLERQTKENRQKIFDCQNQITGERKENEKSAQRIGFLRQRIQELTNGFTADRTEADELDRQISAWETELSGLKSQLSKLEESLAQSGIKIQDAQERHTALRLRDGEHKKESFRIQGDLARFTHEAGPLEKELLRIQVDLANRNIALQELEKSEQADESAVLKKEIDLATEQLRREETDWQDSESEVANLRSREQDLIQALNKIASESENLLRQRQKYLEIKEKLNGNVNRNFFGSSGCLQEQVQAEKSRFSLLDNFYFDEIDAPIFDDPESAEHSGAAKYVVSDSPPRVIPADAAQEKGYHGPVKDLYTTSNPQTKSALKDGFVVDNVIHGLHLARRFGVDAITEQAEFISRDGLVIKNRTRGVLEVIAEIKEIDQRHVELAKSNKETEASLLDHRQQLDDRLQQSSTAHTRVNTLKEKLLVLNSQLANQQKNLEVASRQTQVIRHEINQLQESERNLRGRMAAFEKQRQACIELDLKSQKERDELNRALESCRQQVGEAEKEKLQILNALNLIKEKSEGKLARQEELRQRKEKHLKQLAANEAEIKNLQNEIVSCQEKSRESTTRVTGWEQQKQDMEKAVSKEEERFDAINGDIKRQTQDLSTHRQALEVLREAKKEAEIKMAAVKKDLFQLEEVASQELNSELKDLVVAAEYVASELAPLEAELEELSQRLSKMRDSDRLNLSAETEYEILEKDFGFLNAQKEDIIQSIHNLHDAITKIDQESKESFMITFQKVKENFIRNFQILFEGGEAEITLQDEGNILETGLDIRVQPPGKQLQNLRLLSGGEKTLTSLAFLFSLFEYKPSPFCVFDEVDASLDEANIQRFLKFLHQLKERTQFVIITHNFKTMEEADYIYGISMDEPGVSKIYSIKMH